MSRPEDQIGHIEQCGETRIRLEARITALTDELAAKDRALIELLTLIMHEDEAYVEGGPRRLDEAAWRIAAELPDLPDELRQYLPPSPSEQETSHD